MGQSQKYLRSRRQNGEFPPARVCRRRRRAARRGAPRPGRPRARGKVKIEGSPRAQGEVPVEEVPGPPQHVLRPPEEPVPLLRPEGRRQECVRVRRPDPVQVRHLSAPGGVLQIKKHIETEVQVTNRVYQHKESCAKNTV